MKLVILLILSTFVYVNTTHIWSAKYTEIKEVKLNSRTGFGGHYIEVNFDEPLYAGSALANISEELPDDVPFSKRQMGASRMICGCLHCKEEDLTKFEECKRDVSSGNIYCIYESLNDWKQTLIPKGFFPLVPTNDTLGLLYDKLTQSGLEHKVKGLEKQMQGILFTHAYDEKIDNFVAYVPEKLDISACRIQFMDPASSPSGAFYTTDDGRQQPIGPLSTDNLVRTNARCDPFLLDAIIQDIQEYIMSNISANVEDLEKAFWNVYSFEFHPTWLACANKAYSMFTGAVKEKSFTKSHACTVSPSDATWATDPCCNEKLQQEQCCVAKPRGSLVQNIKSVLPEVVSEKCVDGDMGTRQIHNFMKNKFTADIICTDDSEAHGGTFELVEDLVEFYSACYQKVFNQTCLTDVDCYTRCNPLTHKCTIPYEHPWEILSLCHTNWMNAELKSILYNR